MEDIKTLKCEVCKVGAPLISDEKITEFLQMIPQWQITEEDGIKKLIRKFTFKDFRETLAFINKVGNIAEENGHHPQILAGYNHVTLWWWTHKIKGLHLNDFIMAAKTDSLMN